MAALLLTTSCTFNTSCNFVFRLRYFVILIFIHSLAIFVSFVSCRWSCQPMAAENHETSNGWPLGLQIMNIRLGLQQRLQAAAPAVELYFLHIPSSSFSSFSSSNLDTESSASFFQDNSVSLGKLIGYGPGERESLYLQNSIHTDQSCRLPVRESNGFLKSPHNPSKTRMPKVQMNTIKLDITWKQIFEEQTRFNKAFKPTTNSI
ncbi:hypothetical protein V6Z11_D05G170100 [Gossypium hirsutum]